MTTQDLADYIRDLELADEEPLAGIERFDADLRLDGDAAQAGVVDSNIVTFPAGTPVAVKNAVANWTLLAQRAASRRVPDREQVEAWMTAYNDTLMDTGWRLVEEDTAETDEYVKGSSVHEKILAFATVVLGPVPTALAVVTAAITSLNDMDKSSPWITLFDRRGKDAVAVGFQIANYEAGEGDDAVLRAIDFRVEAHETLTQVFFFKFRASEARMYKRGRVLSLSSERITQLGPQVAAKVEQIASDNIAALDIEVDGVS